MRRFQHAPHADFSAGLFTRCGLKDYHAIVFELLNVAQIGRVEPHLHIHRRRDDQRAGAGGDQIADEIVGDAVRDFGDGVGRGGRNQHHIGFAREVDVGHAIAARAAVGIEQHRITAQGLKRVGMDEFGGAVAHGHCHFMARFF